MQKLFITLIACILFGCSTAKYSFDCKNIEELNQKSDFSFAIFSDNKGDSPYSNTEFAKMVEWIKQNDNKFVLGLGDHLKFFWHNDFLDFVKNNKFWQKNFYPCIADGENEYYGKSQGDWSAGGALLDDLSIASNKNIVERKNLSEYYCIIPVKNYRIHYINLHFPDTPKNHEISFKESSKQWLKKKLNGIDKSKFDIIIVAAHSSTGFWAHLLNPGLQKLLLTKADLVLSGTTHIHKKQRIKGFEQTGALCLNTGAMCYARGYSSGGYLNVNVLKNNAGLVVQYINTSKQKFKLANASFAYIKYANGKHGSLTFNK